MNPTNGFRIAMGGISIIEEVTIVKRTLFHEHHLWVNVSKQGSKSFHPFTSSHQSKEGGIAVASAKTLPRSGNYHPISLLINVVRQRAVKFR